MEEEEEMTPFEILFSIYLVTQTGWLAYAFKHRRIARSYELQIDSSSIIYAENLRQKEDQIKTYYNAMVECRVILDYAMEFLTEEQKQLVADKARKKK